MKRVVFSFCFFVFLLGCMLPVSAQPPQKLVTVIVTPDRSSWQYHVNDPVTFTIQVLKHENPVQNVAVDYEIGPEFFGKQTKDVVLKEGKLTLKSSMSKPGFLRCKVTAKVDGQTYDGMATAGIDPEKIQPTTKEPGDFDSFWNNAINEARKTPLDPILTLMPERCTSALNVYQISFQNERIGSRIYGILMMPKKPGKYPAILQVPGAGIRPYNGTSFGDDVISLEIGIHGIPVDLPQYVYNNLSNGALSGYWAINKNDRDKHYYKRVYLGCVRAIDFIYSLPEFDGQTVGVTGGSQGGALSIVTAGLDPRIQFVAALFPALCDYAGYLNNRAGGWPHYFRSEKPAANDVETLAYFDVVNFAKRIKAPGWYSWGYNDTTCPPTSTYSAYNQIIAPKELHLFLETGHWTFPEQANERIAWLQKQYHK